MSRKILFITGSDTGIGKTTVAAALVAALRKAGNSPHVLKPFETGCVVVRDQGLRAMDAEMLWNVSGRNQPFEEVVFYKFITPVAPIVAAKAENQEIDFEQVVDQIIAQAEKAEILIVEGAGGLLVPLSEDFTFADIISRCQAASCHVGSIPVIGSRLGAINHALLTFEVMRLRGLPTLGYVLNDLFNDNSGHEPDPALSTNRELLGRLARKYNLSELAYFPYLSADGLSSDTIRQFTSNFVLPLTEAVIEYFDLSRYSK